MSEYYMTHTGRELDDAINKVKSGFIDKTKISHFATGVINNVTEGQQVRITGITDAMTGETFNLKGVVGILCPASTTNYTTSSGKGALVAFYKTSDSADGIGVASYTPAYSVRANVGMKNNDILGISGNGFSFLSPASMYALMPATRWRWFAWG